MTAQHLKILLVTLCCSFGLHAQQRPKVGLTLSGGGAKGLAHIGLLKAIDSAGIQVDYVTGTSMGAVIGSMYAAGYSGREIDSLFRKLDLVNMLSNAPTSINMRESRDLGHYVELPLNKGKLSFNRGIIESNELWLKLAEVFYDKYETVEFSKFPRSFQCMATDAATGEIVVLQRGNIVDAIRASMAIPSLFTAVEIDGRVLIDGGVKRNFPVTNVKGMGAEIVMGSDVSDRPKPAGEIASPMDIISRLPFYDASSDLAEQRKLVDYYVDYELGGHGTGSFGAAREIMAIGDARGKALFPKLLRLRDSLDAQYGALPKPLPVKRRDSVYIDSYQVRGLGEADKKVFVRAMGFSPEKWYRAADITDAIRQTFGTQLYSKINFSLKKRENGQTELEFEVIKAAPIKIMFGVHYNSTTGIALKVGSQKRGFLNPFSYATAMLAVGENTRGVATFLSYLNKSRTLAWQAESNFCVLDISTYNADYSQSGLYYQSTQDSDLQFFWQPKHNWTIGIGATLSNVNYVPRLTSTIQAEGTLIYNTAYFFAEHQTLDADVYPSRGRKLSIKAGLIFNQKPDYEIYLGETLIANHNAPYFNFDPYEQMRLAYQEYVPVGRHALFLDFESGMNFNYKQLIMNDFMVGGLSHVIRNQITYAGLPEGAIFCTSAASLKLGLQYTLVRNLYLKPQVNGLLYDFVQGNEGRNTAKAKLGGSITCAYKTFLGAIETSLMYTNGSKSVLPYFNLGYALQL